MLREWREAEHAKAKCDGDVEWMQAVWRVVGGWYMQDINQMIIKCAVSPGGSLGNVEMG